MMSWMDLGVAFVFRQRTWDLIRTIPLTNAKIPKMSTKKKVDRWMACFQSDCGESHLKKTCHPPIEH
jgi:hypothetical protein